MRECINDLYHIRFIQPRFVVANVRCFSQAIRQQNFCSDDLETETPSFVGQDLHETIQTLGVSSSHTVSEVGKDRVSVLLNRHSKGPEHISNIGSDLIEPCEITLEGFLFGGGFIDAVKSFLEPLGSFQPGEVFEPGFKDQRFMFVQIVRASQQQKSVMHQGSSLSICQAGSYVLANGFKTLVKQLQNVPFVCYQMGMWQNLMNGIMVSCPQISTDNSDLFLHLFGQMLQITNDRLLTAVSKQLDDLMMLDISKNTTVLVQQVQFIDAQVACSCFWKTGLDSGCEFTEHETNQLLIDSHLIGNAGESSAQRYLLNVADQTLCHEMVLVHVWNRLKEGSETATTTVTSPMNDDADMFSSDRLVQVSLRLYLMPVQLRMAAMSTTRRRRDQLRLDMKVVFILIYRKDVVIGQSQDVQKALSPKKELPHKFFGGPEIPVAGERRLLRAFCSYSTRFSDVTLLCTDVKDEEFPRTFPNSRKEWTDISLAHQGDPGTAD